MRLWVCGFTADWFSTGLRAWSCNLAEHVPSQHWLTQSAQMTAFSVPRSHEQQHSSEIRAHDTKQRSEAVSLQSFRDRDQRTTETCKVGKDDEDRILVRQWTWMILILISLRLCGDIRRCAISEKKALWRVSIFFLTVWVFAAVLSFSNHRVWSEIICFYYCISQIMAILSTGFKRMSKTFSFWVDWDF